MRVRKQVGLATFEVSEAEPAVAADGAGITALRGMTSFQPAPLLNSVVRHTGEVVDTALGNRLIELRARIVDGFDAGNWEEVRAIAPKCA